jgi:hypothetical protein
MGECQSKGWSRATWVKPAPIRDTAKSGMGWIGNRYLSDLAESDAVNVGGSSQDVKLSSPTRSAVSFGGPIIVGEGESPSRGEGDQAANVLPLER